jgi:N-acyl-D-aspartate/D-glutamate deacylase
MPYDLLIKNGTIVDGTGAPRYLADVAVSGGRIAEIGKVSDSARKVIDASDLIVSPGFVDPHTHYDAQICWDPQVSCSSWHGITSVVMGNCGVGLAPCKPDVHEIATLDLVNVEGIPARVLNAGITWDWESFPSYLDAAARRGSSLNLGFLAPLTPFRHYVMGEASMERAATPDETERIAALLSAAVQAGARGFSTTTGRQHVGYKGRPLACRLSSREELASYSHVLRKLGRGVIEITLTQDFGNIADHEYDLLDFLLTESGRPVTWLAVFDRDDQPEASQSTLARTDPLIKRGGIPQVACRPFVSEFSMRRAIAFVTFASWKRAYNQPVEVLRQLFAEQEFRDSLAAEIKRAGWDWEKVTVTEVANPDLKAYENRNIAQLAQQRGKAGHELDVMVELALEDNLEMWFSRPAFNISPERVGKLINDPRTLIGLSDGGAHVNMLCDAGYCTFLLGTWVRERGAMTLEYAVRRITSEPADFFGIKDRGRLVVGGAADITIFDYDTVGSPQRGEMRADLPGGGKRLVMPAHGVIHTVVNGTPVYEDSKYTGATPGQVIRW